MSPFIPPGAARPVASAGGLTQARPGCVPHIAFHSTGGREAGGLGGWPDTGAGPLGRRDDPRRPRPHADAGQGAVRALERPVELPPWAVTLGGGRSVEPDTRHAEGGGKVEGPGVAPDDDRRSPEQRDELRDRACWRELYQASARRVHDRLRGLALPRAPADEHRPAGLRGEARGEGGEAVGRPALGDPPGAWQEDDEPVAGLYAPARQEGVDPGLGGRVPRQRELDRGGPDAERLEQREVLLDHVARGGGRRHVAVREERAEAFAAEPSGEAEPERGARRGRQQPALQEPLQIEGDVEARRAKLSRELAEGAARGREIEGRERPPPTPGVHRNDRVQNPVAREQRRLASLHDPGEAGARQPPAERRRDRQRVDDVTERRELDERDVHRKRSTIREIRSRVE